MAISDVCALASESCGRDGVSVGLGVDASVDVSVGVGLGVRLGMGLGMDVGVSGASRFCLFLRSTSLSLSPFLLSSQHQRRDTREGGGDDRVEQCQKRVELK